MQLLTPIIVHEEEDFLIINKPPGWVVHRDLHHTNETIWDFIKEKLNFQTKQINPGIVHRLDKPTSGLIIIARNEKTWVFLKEEMRKRKIERKYYALVEGIITKKKIKVDVALSKPGKYKRAKPRIIGAKAITYFQTIKTMQNKKQTLLECQLETGRTHQIRSHLKFLNFPIINDPLYKGGKSEYIYLHAYYLSFFHPITKKKFKIKISLPNYFEQQIFS